MEFNLRIFKNRCAIMTNKRPKWIEIIKWRYKLINAIFHIFWYFSRHAGSVRIEEMTSIWTMWMKIGIASEIDLIAYDLSILSNLYYLFWSASLCNLLRISLSNLNVTLPLGDFARSELCITIYKLKSLLNIVCIARK